MPVTQELRDKIGQITNLPTLPQVATRLMKIVNDPITSSSDVAFIVGQDLSLSAKVLRLANSAFYGMPRTITNINNAVVILGLRVINTMVLSLTVFDMFPEDKKKSLFNRGAFWKHSLGCGLICKLLAARVNKFVLFDPEEAFCAGLLHDVGKVAMEQYMHDDFRNALIHAQKHRKPAFEAEQELLGYTHTEVADWLTSGWELPLELHAPLVYHHSPGAVTQCADAVSLCHYADYLCYELGMAVDDKAVRPALDKKAVEGLRMTSADIEFIKSVLPDEVKKMDVFMDIASGK
jgi:HD-like signal output (HDOD) protein